MNAYHFVNSDLSDRYCAIYQSLPSHVRLVCVSKTQPAAAIRHLCQLGQRDFGENYLQEALDKIHELADLPIAWHYIGHIQRNKTRDLAYYFDWVHGVDRLIIAKRLSEQRANSPKNSPLNMCIQVNIDNETSKSGCQLADVPALVAQISRLPNVSLRGLMIIPDPTKDSRLAFGQLKQLFDECRQCHANPSLWDTLSMGMSADMAEAITHGSTMVRVGTAIFGRRL